MPHDVVLSEPTTRRISPFLASHPRGPFTNLYQSAALAAAYSLNLAKFLRRSDLAPLGIVKIAPSEADDSKIISLYNDNFSSQKKWMSNQTHEIAVPVCDLFTEELARWLPSLNTTKLSISVASIGGEMGENFSGNIRGFTGSL